MLFSSRKILFCVSLFTFLQDVASLVRVEEKSCNSETRRDREMRSSKMNCKEIRMQTLEEDFFSVFIGVGCGISNLCLKL